MASASVPPSVAVVVAVIALIALLIVLRHLAGGHVGH
jgi:hypothetical protein